jgi:hypothetical protein
VDLSELVRAVLSGDALHARLWVLAARGVVWSCVPRPAGLGLDELAVAAALIELLAERDGQAAPGWTASVGAASRPMCLVRNAGPRMRKRLETESPEPLRRRNLFAPSDYLRAA